MTTLVSFARFQELTGDTTSASATVEAALDLAVDLVEEALDRFLEEGTYTEWLPVHLARGREVWPNGATRCYPSAYPVSAVTSPSGASLLAGSDRIIQGVGLATTPASLDDLPLTHVQVTYTGGYTAATLPKGLERIIVLVARAIVAEYAGSTPLPGGVTGLKLGDAQVTFTSGVSPSMAALETLVPGIGHLCRPWRKRW